METSETLTSQDLSTGLLFSHRPMKLSTGGEIKNIEIGYTITGKFPNDGNYILICHAFTGDQYVAQTNPINGRPGWWADYIGKGKAIVSVR